MALRHYGITVSTTAIALEGTQYPGWVLRNTGDETVYMGGDSTVTTSTGFPVEAGEVFAPSEMSSRQLTGQAVDRLYGISTTSSTVRILIPGKTRG